MLNIEKKLIYSNNPKIKLPYIMYIPKDYDSNSNLIVELQPMLPMQGSLKNVIDEIVNEEMEPNRINSMLYMLMNNLSYPAIFPILPRVNGFYTSYLGSQVLNNNFSKTNLNDEEKTMLSNIDIQVKEMIIEATKALNINPKAILKGYSATAKFATQFSILHPEVVEYNISGGTSGLSTLPIKELNGIKLVYPIGVYDVNFNEEEFRKIKHFFYIGSEDNNDPGMPKAKLSNEKDANGNILPLKDSNGNYEFIYDDDNKLLPLYGDCYTKEEINIIHNLYEHDNIKRFLANAKIYDDLGINSVHKIYEGNHATIFGNNREQIVNDIISYIEKEKEINR